MLLGVDIGTTHCKAGLFHEDGRPIHIASRPMAAQQAPEGFRYYDPEALWQTAAAVIGEATAAITPGAVAAVGVTSMAETGLLIDRASGQPRSPLLPWFDSSAAPQAERLARSGDSFERFCRAGIYPNFKVSLAKILWLRDHGYTIEGAVWLCVADYILYRLTGAFATDASLACRTYAFRLDEMRWDGEWLDQFGLSAELFPALYASGQPAGMTGHGQVPAGTPVAVAGHDHICGALAAGIIEPGHVFDSIGTAEALFGAIAARPLGQAEFDSGLNYGCHVVAGRLYWIGGLSASGGSIEWLRAIMGDPPLSYAGLDDLLNEAPDGPTGILYFPHLAGSSTPRPDPAVRAAFLGLSSEHGRADLLKAVLEGTAFELEGVRRAAEKAMGRAIEMMTVVGGGTRNRRWLQIKADISGCYLAVPAMPEATLLGAALIAGVGAGVYANAEHALASLAATDEEAFVPDSDRLRRYMSLYEERYLPASRALRRLANAEGIHGTS